MRNVNAQITELESWLDDLEQERESAWKSNDTERAERIEGEMEHHQYELDKLLMILDNGSMTIYS